MGVLWQSHHNPIQCLMVIQCLQGTDTKAMFGKYAVCLNMMPNLYLLIFDMLSEKHGYVLGVIHKLQAQ